MRTNQDVARVTVDKINLCQSLPAFEYIYTCLCVFSLSTVSDFQLSVQAHLMVSGEWLDLGDHATGLQPVNGAS